MLAAAAACLSECPGEGDGDRGDEHGETEGEQHRPTQQARGEDAFDRDIYDYATTHSRFLVSCEDASEYRSNELADLEHALLR